MGRAEDTNLAADRSLRRKAGVRILTVFQKAFVFLVLGAVCCSFAGCGSSRKHQSPQEEAEGYYWYEAVFLEKKDVEKAFRTASSRFPSHEFVPDAFHVTTQYKPEQRHESLYGTAVTVHVTGYISGSVYDAEEGLFSENEGLLVEVSSADEEMQALLDSYDRVWHITGSYTGAAKYTGQLDLSGAIPMDLTIEGVYGIADSDGIVKYE